LVVNSTSTSAAPRLGVILDRFVIFRMSIHQRLSRDTERRSHHTCPIVATARSGVLYVIDK
jgi:hypothetical protein